MSKTFTSKRLKTKTKIRILKCYIFSIFTYGSEAWTLSKVLEQKIEAFEIWCYRWMANISWKDKVTNENVLKKLDMKRTLLKDVQKRKLRYYGHVKRKNNFLTTAMEEGMRGKRLRTSQESTCSVMSRNGLACRLLNAQREQPTGTRGVSFNVNLR